MDTGINNLPLTDITVTFWAKTRSGSQAGSRPIGYENSGSGANGLAVYYPSATNPWLIMRNAGTTYDMSMGTIIAEIWYQYTVTISSIDGTIVYLNGVRTNSNTSAKSYTSASVTFHMGSAGNAAVPFKGSMDDVRVYNRVLSAAEIARMYQLTQPKPSLTE